MRTLRPSVRLLLSWFNRNARDLPWRRGKDPYAIWISEIMLQQTQVQTVIPYWIRWMSRFPSVRSLSRARTETILRLWAGLGYYNRAKNLRHAARIIVEHHRGVFPSRIEDLLRLPGVGRYTAGAICSIAFNQPTPVVDGNVARVLVRFLGIQSDPRQAETRNLLWNTAQKLVETAAELDSARTRNCSALNQALMELGALVCAPRHPLCEVCPLKRTCVANRTHRAEKLPAPASRPKPASRHFIAFALCYQQSFLVRKRSSSGVNAGLWEFPNSEITESDGTIEGAARKCLGPCPPKLSKLGTIRHTITRYRIRLDIYQGFVSTRPKEFPAGSHWRTLSQLNQLPLPSAHRKIADMLKKQR